MLLHVASRLKTSIKCFSFVISHRYLNKCPEANTGESFFRCLVLTYFVWGSFFRSVVHSVRPQIDCEISHRLMGIFLRLAAGIISQISSEVFEMCNNMSCTNTGHGMGQSNEKREEDFYDAQ